MEMHMACKLTPSAAVSAVALFVAATCAAPASAPAQTATPAAPAAAVAATTAAAAVPAAAPGDGTDRLFIDRAATGTGGEFELGQLAEHNGYSRAVRSLGAHIAYEHSRLQARLMAIAQRLGVDPHMTPWNLGPMIVLSGPEFDRQFMTDQVADQRQALALFESEAQTGANPQLRHFARESLPLLRRDLGRAEALAAKAGA
jgi:putative membrane protein